MASRLDIAEAELLSADATRARSRHSCSLFIVDRPANFDVDEVMEYVDGKLAAAPRYRQRVREVPLGLARAVWVDDPDFDLSFHVRRSALPVPGGMRQLADLVARLVDRPLEPGRPLWEMYLIEGLADGRLAVLTKSHYVLVGGRNAVDLAQVLLDDEAGRLGGDEVPTWSPSSNPGDGVLVLDALITLISDPQELFRRPQRALIDVGRTVRGVLEKVSKPILWPSSGLESMFEVSRPRGSRVGLASFPLADVREIARAHGTNVNDVVLSVLCGALRSWILSMGKPLSTAATLRAIVPMAVRSSPDPASDDPRADGPVGGTDHMYTSEQTKAAEVSSVVIAMPVGETNPRMRLAQIARETASQRQLREAVGAQTLARLSGFAPPTLHAMGSRAARLLPRGTYDLVVTNAPGPQHRMYWVDGELDEVYPVPALIEGQALAVSLSSYDGVVYCGFTADREAVPDVEEIGELISGAISELEEPAE